jgi:Lar family restriction alleviation protein
MEELKECPFCGENDGEYDEAENRIICNSCGAQGPRPPSVTANENRALRDWNDRKDDKSPGPEAPKVHKKEYHDTDPSS